MKWYDSTKQVLAQALNINGPITNLPGAGMPQAPMRPTPQQQNQLPQAPQPPTNQTEPGLTPEEQSLIALRPPLHDRCHCEIRTLPGGRQIWDSNETACLQCDQIKTQFNALQDRLFFNQT